MTSLNGSRHLQINRRELLTGMAAGLVAVSLRRPWREVTPAEARARSFGDENYMIRFVLTMTGEGIMMLYHGEFGRISVQRRYRHTEHYAF
jgi:hypothetical protein